MQMQTQATGLGYTSQDISTLRVKTLKAARACVRGPLVEDVAQELWVTAWQRLRDGLPEMSFVEMKHRAWDVLRRERRHEHEGEEAAAGVVAPSENVLYAKSYDVLEEVKLTVQEAMVLVRRYWFGDTVRALAERVGLDVAVVRGLEVEALKKIAGELDRRLRDDR